MEINPKKLIYIYVYGEYISITTFSLHQNKKQLRKITKYIKENFVSRQAARKEVIEMRR